MAHRYSSDGGLLRTSVDVNAPRVRPSSTPSMSLSASRRTIRGFAGTGASLQVLTPGSSSDRPRNSSMDRVDDDDAVVIDEVISSPDASPVKQKRPTTNAASPPAQVTTPPSAAVRRSPPRSATSQQSSPRPNPSRPSTSSSSSSSQDDAYANRTPAAVAQTQHESQAAAPKQPPSVVAPQDNSAVPVIAQPQLSVRPSSCGIGTRPRHVNLGKKELLGKGSFGMVYRAMDLDTNHIIAVKEVTITPGTLSAEQLQKFRQEISLMQQLDHPNIVKCLGEHWDGTQHLRIFMEYVAGGTISSILRSFGPFGEMQASRFTSQILQGLQYLHAKRIAHRDLKGDNLLMDINGSVKLADFGTAKELATRTKSMAGTAFFMAPEVIRGVGHGIEADVWSLGACVVEMLLGKPPFHTFTNPYAIMMHIAELKDEEFPIPSTASLSCRDFLNRCFRIEPSSRASVNELLQHPWITDPPETADLRTINVLLASDNTVVSNQAQDEPPISGNTFAKDSYNPIQSFGSDV